MSPTPDTTPKPVYLVPIAPPPEDQRVQRNSAPAAEGEKRTRYTLPKSLESGSPVGYRTRISMNSEETQHAMQLLSMRRPTSFRPPTPVSDAELFEESALGILSSRQSTNYRGFRQVSLGPEGSKELATLMRELDGADVPVLDNASYSHIILSRPYRTPFTLLLTFAGHKPFLNLFTVPKRAWNKRQHHIDDIPTIGYLQHLHIGILADAMERATVLASGGVRRAQVHLKPFTGAFRAKNKERLQAIERLCGLTAKEKAAGWTIAIAAQVGNAIDPERITIPKETARKISANLLAFRSERIQPGVNQEEKAPAGYQKRQDMDVHEDLTVACGRAGFNAFTHWTGVDREKSKEIVMLERMDVLTPGGKERLRGVRKMLNEVTDWLVRDIPLWADLATGRALSKNANRGRKAFSLAGQRIYVGGLSKSEMANEGVDWELGVRAFGALASRTALVAEFMGVLDIPQGCDMLAGICMMAGPVNQNDVGKQFYKIPDLLKHSFPNREPESLLVWTLKAKTIADPLGNEEQLMNAKRKGALVDLRAAPHEVIQIVRDGNFTPLRKNGAQTSQERAFADQANFVTAPDGSPIPGNEGVAWDPELANKAVW